MIVQMTGSNRPKLSLSFDRMISSQPQSQQGSPNLSGVLSNRELRRIVTEMLG